MNTIKTDLTGSLIVNSRLEKRFVDRVNGKTILITGASSGIGLTTAHRLANAGAHVLLVARTKETFDAVKAEIEATGGKADVFHVTSMIWTPVDAVAQQIPRFRRSYRYLN